MMANIDANTNQPGGHLIVLAAPSGAGKSTIAVRLRDNDIALLSVSHTTRAARKGERHGEQYFFVGKDEFDQMCASGAFLEWAQVHDNRYGTSAQWVLQQLARGKKVLLEIDCQGAAQVRDKMPAVGIFVAPPSMAELRRRLQGRGQDSPAEIDRRMTAADAEMRRQNEFDYVIINDDLDSAVRRVGDIVAAL